MKPEIIKQVEQPMAPFIKETEEILGESLWKDSEKHDMLKGNKQKVKSNPFLKS